MVSKGVKIALILAAGLFLALTASKFLQQKRTLGKSVPAEVLTAFGTWAKSHKRAYKTPAEKSYRLNLFHQTYLRVKSHNAKKLSWSLGLNHLSDLSKSEFLAKYTGLKRHAKAPKNVELKLLQANPSNNANWTAAGAVTPVKNQGNCGSCWAFSSTGALEGLNFIKNKPSSIASYSEQQLVDCSTSYGNHGCNGGLMQNAFKYVQANGITTEQNYPYTAKDGTCKTKTGVFKITGYKNVPHKSSGGLAGACDGQPVSVSIDATNIQSYKSGIFADKNCGTSLNHGVLLTAYDSNVWYVKNSWGQSWGEAGYIRFSRTAVSDASGGICGILLDASYPTA